MEILIPDDFYREAHQKIYNSLLDLSEFFQERRLEDLSKGMKISPRLFDIIKYYLIHTQKIDNVDTYIDELGIYLKKVLAQDIVKGSSPKDAKRRITALDKLKPFGEQERSLLSIYFVRVKSDLILSLTNRLISLLEKSIQDEDAGSGLADKHGLDYHKVIDSTMGKLMLALNVKKKQLSVDCSNTAGLFLFYFSLYKLFQSSSIVSLINNFIPKKKNKRGKVVRDKHRQIKELLNKSKQYQENYYKLVKTLYPIINRQVMAVVETFNLSNLLLKDKQGHVHKLAYLTLFTNFLHETVHSGLSVIIGFRHRPATRAFERAAEQLLSQIGLN